MRFVGRFEVAKFKEFYSLAFREYKPKICDSNPGSRLLACMAVSNGQRTGIWVNR